MSPGDFSWGREERGFWRHFQRRECADRSRTPSWVSSNKQWKCNRVMASEVQAGSENYCSERFRRNGWEERERGSESQMTLKRTWCLHYTTISQYHGPTSQGRGALPGVKEVWYWCPSRGTMLSSASVVFIWCPSLDFWYWGGQYMSEKGSLSTKPRLLYHY